MVVADGDSAHDDGRHRGPAAGQAARNLAADNESGSGSVPCLGHCGHEVAVAAPAGHDVHMQVLADTAPGGAAQVDAHVDAPGRVGRPSPLARRR